MKSVLNMTVLVAALGYFVDIFDLLLFGVVRVPSLQSLGVSPDDILSVGVTLLDYQMIGVLLGGILWGVLGDRGGRVSVLFGSILLYSAANLANAFIHSVEAYAFLRFLAGLGLAGELGGAITLVSEVLPKEKRGYGTTLVASVGLCGSIFAAVVVEYTDWRTAYAIGGLLGFGLLALRMKVHEPEIFKEMQNEAVSRGNFFSLFQNWERFVKYFSLILIGVPVWFAIGIVMTFSPEIGKELGIQEPITAGNALFYGYTGLALGDLASGLLSQWTKSRRVVMGGCMILMATTTLVIAFSPGATSSFYYTACLMMGLGSGYWAVFMTSSTEQFGTNLRATATTTIPTFVRGMVIPMTFFFQALTPRVGLMNGVLTLGVLCFFLAAIALYTLKESYGRDLNFLEVG